MSQPAVARAQQAARESEVGTEHFAWLFGALCRIFRLPFDVALLLQQFPPPHARHDLHDAARALGFRSGELALTREGAARFSFLLAVPGIGMAGAYELLQLLRGPANGADWSMMGLGIAVAAVTGYLCIHWLLKVIGRIGLGPFAIYRFAIAALILLAIA